MRKETDSIGHKLIPKDAFYGIQSVRAYENFNITNEKLNPKLISAIGYVKKASAIANKRVGLLDSKKAEFICKACDKVINNELDSEFICDPIQGGAGTSINMNANEVIANYASMLAGYALGKYEYIHPNDHVNLAQSTNDVFPTTGKLTLLNLIGEFELIISDLILSLRAKALQFDNVLKMGRTHLQDAVPMTMGQDFRAFSAPLERDLKHLSNFIDELKTINMGATAVGTGLNSNVEYINIYPSILSKLTNIDFSSASDLIDSTKNTDSFLFLSAIIRNCAVNLSKMSNDIRLMASGPLTGLAELQLPAMQPGSSIMPGKINPVIAEVLNQTCFDVIGNDLTCLKAVEAGQLQLNVFEPVLFYNLIKSITHLSNGVKTFNKRLIKDLKVNEVNCKAHLDKSICLVTALVPHIGYAKSAEIAKLALKENKSVEKIVLAQKLLTIKQLNNIMDVKAMTTPGIAGENEK